MAKTTPAEAQPWIRALAERSGTNAGNRRVREVAQAFYEVLHTPDFPPRLQPDSVPSESGLDSLHTVDLLNGLEEKLGLRTRVLDRAAGRLDWNTATFTDYMLEVFYDYNP